MKPSHHVRLILTRDAEGRVVLIRHRDEDAPVTLCRSSCRANRDRNLRRRWLREVDAATCDVLAVDLTR